MCTCVLMFPRGLNVPPIITHLYATITLTTLVTNEVELTFDVSACSSTCALEPFTNARIRSTTLWEPI